MLHKVKRFIHSLFISKKKEREVQYVAETIGNFYLDKNQGDYKKTANEIIQLGITKVDFRGIVVSVTLTRPGLLIGRRGENIDKLTAYLSDELNRKIELKIIEDRITGWLIPQEPYSDADIDSALFGT